MTIRLGVVMDAAQHIHYEKDSTLAMLFEAEVRGWQIFYFEQKDLYLKNNIPFGHAKLMELQKNPKAFATFLSEQTLPLAELDVILMRKDPPVNEEFIYTTYILEHAEKLGVLVINRPESLRNANEKLFATFFPQCIPETLVTASKKELKAFWKEHQDIVCKPLNAMGGTNIFRLQNNDPNANTIFEILTERGELQIMAQQFIPAIKEGDKRILMINGEAFPSALYRIPVGDEWRGNLVLGAKSKALPLTERDQFICETVGPVLRERGLYFVGLDVIGDYLTEINVTSPTGIRELDHALDKNISATLMDFVADSLAS